MKKKMPDDLLEGSTFLNIEPYEPSAPEDGIYFDADVADVAEQGESVLGIWGPVWMIPLLREAKEKHLPVMFTNNDNTRALVIKDANDLKCKITVNGVPFEEI